MSTISRITAEDAVRAVSELLEERGRDFGDICADTPVRELGLDSLDVAELFMALEEIAGARIDVDSRQAVVLVGDLAALELL